MKNKSRFISSLAHDLKNSIGNNMMYSELLSTELQEYAASNEKMQHDDFENWLLMSENIRLSSSKLINQINSWVYVHHFIAGEYKEELSTFSLGGLIESIVNSNMLFITNKELQVEHEWDGKDYLISADKEMLTLILDNLLIQSIVYSNNGDHIKVSILDENETFTIELTDSYSSPRPEVIQRFLVEDEVTGDEIPEEGILKATGFGMIFCGLAIKKIGAKASVDENSLGGLTFSIRLKK